MVIEIRPLDMLRPEDLALLGGGYVSPGRYVVRKTETPELTTITVELRALAKPYVKQWRPPAGEELERYRDYARQGYSVRAYADAAPVGFALCEARMWNRCLWVWELHVAASHRRRGIGRRLMEEVARRAGGAGFRIVGLETQSTNVPAVAFYRAVGFELDAIDLSLYSNTDAGDGEVALFMKRKL